MSLTSHLMMLLFCLAASMAMATEPVDFVNDVIPLVTKHGCNAGSCHGAAVGRGGFKLSLYGSDPVADHTAMVRQVGGRRVNLVHPRQSLIVMKPTESIAHGGGTVFDMDSPSGRLLVDWVEQGALMDWERSLVRLDVSPQWHLVRAVGESIQLRAIAHYSDGTARDVTQWTIFFAEDTSAIAWECEPVTPTDRQGPQAFSATRGGSRSAYLEDAVRPVESPTVDVRAIPLRRGRHVLIARYASQVVPVELVVPLADASPESQPEPENFIDAEILDTLAVMGIPPPDVADDATWLRRLALDLTGRIPEAVPVLAEWQQRLATTHVSAPALSAAERQSITERLLASEEFVEYWTLQLAKWLNLHPDQGDDRALGVYHAWLKEQIRHDVSYRAIARDLILASGDTHQNGPANFYRTAASPSGQAEFFSELFMGSRLRCANCHNHPFDRWTQDDYHGLAAIFAQVQGGRVVQAKPNGYVIHPKTLEPAVPGIPGQHDVPGQADNARESLADWLTAPENPYFTKVIVNRLWKRMMGHGLVEPEDDFRATNPATHPVLLEQLAEDFQQHGYSIRHTLRMFANSRTYARSASNSPRDANYGRLYAQGARRPLEPEVLADAISDVLEVPVSYGSAPLGMRAVALPDPHTPSETLDILGRCGLKSTCPDPAAGLSDLSQTLHLFNGELLNGRIAAGQGRLGRLLNQGQRPMEIVSSFYAVALCRQPTEAEEQHWRQQIAALENADSQQSFLEDFVWGLLACDEFTTNH